MSTVTVTDESFEKDVLQAQGPVLVDFWAEWCGPCKQIAPALEQISDDLAGQVTIAMLFKDGQMSSMKVGAMPKQKILEWLSEAGVQPAA
jgi:thioredoxin 1